MVSCPGEGQGQNLKLPASTESRMEVDGRLLAGGTRDAPSREGAAAATPRRIIRNTPPVVEDNGAEVDNVTVEETGAVEATGAATIQAAEEDGNLAHSLCHCVIVLL